MTDKFSLIKTVFEDKAIRKRHYSVNSPDLMRQDVQNPTNLSEAIICYFKEASLKKKILISLCLSLPAFAISVFQVIPEEFKKEIFTLKKEIKIQKIEFLESDIETFVKITTHNPTNTEQLITNITVKSEWNFKYGIIFEQSFSRVQFQQTIKILDSTMQPLQYKGNGEVRLKKNMLNKIAKQEKGYQLIDNKSMEQAFIIETSIILPKEPYYSFYLKIPRVLDGFQVPIIQPIRRKKDRKGVKKPLLPEAVEVPSLFQKYAHEKDLIDQIRRTELFAWLILVPREELEEITTILTVDIKTSAGSPKRSRQLANFL